MSDVILKIGRVIQVSSAKVIGVLDGSVENLYRTHKSRRYALGQIGSIVKIEVGDRLVFGVVTALRMAETPLEGTSAHVPDPASSAKWLEIELFGEALRAGLGEDDFDFQRGVVTYPLPGHGIFVASFNELSRIHHQPDRPSIRIGTLSHTPSLPVHLLMDDLLGKHFAVLGTTGAGKSCAVTVLLRAILDTAKKAHVILLDPHNEYRQAFLDEGEIVDPTTLNLPHWLLNFEESVELFVGKTEYAATSQVNILKEAMLEARQHSADRLEDIPKEMITVDTPVPYKMSTLIECIRKGMGGKPDSKTEPHRKIIGKIETLQNDTRFAFLVRPDNEVRDDLQDTISRYLRIPVADKPISIIDLSGVPSDVVDVVVSVLCRMVFDFAVWSPRPVQVPVVLVCEEAHRYAPRSDEAAFQPTKKALSRIAKEGRKYGVGLGLISQRPSELSESILSQCNTLIALRMSNERDQQFVRRMLPESILSLVDVLPALRTREALVIGEGSMIPMRLQFSDLPEDKRPHSANVPFSDLWSQDSADAEYVKDVIHRWRRQERPPQKN